MFAAEAGLDWQPPAATPTGTGSASASGLALPSQARLEYLKTALELLLLVLAMPYLLYRLATNPSSLFRGVGRWHEG